MYMLAFGGVKASKFDVFSFDVTHILPQTKGKRRALQFDATLALIPLQCAAETITTLPRRRRYNSSHVCTEERMSGVLALRVPSKREDFFTTQLVSLRENVLKCLLQ